MIKLYHDKEYFYNKKFYYSKDDIKKEKSIKIFNIATIILSVISLLTSIFKLINFKSIDSELIAIIFFVSVPLYIFIIGNIGVMYDKKRGYY